MIKRLAVCCIVTLAFATANAAEAAVPQKRLKPASKTVRKAAAPTPKRAMETLTCRDGTEDRHARIGVVLSGGKVDSFAYYSKWKPRTCSIYLRRHGDAFSKWSDRGNVTHVKAERGDFQIERDKGGAYRFVFRNVDRERYCGMDGTINGTLVVRKGSQHCEVAGIMEEGTPLGQAWAHLEPAAVAAATAAPRAEAPSHLTQRSGRESVAGFPTFSE